MDEMLQRLNLPNPNKCEIIVESCSGARTCWAELLAAKIGARHFFIASEEKYREGWQVYKDILPFMYFKLMRNEIIGGVEGITRLFNGYKNVTGPLIEFPHIVQEQDAVQDVEFPDIPLSDWNICHIGRHGKDYVRPSILGIAELARRHPNKTISFVLVGDAKPLIDFIGEQFDELENVKRIFCGIRVPIPRILLNQMDVVIAISQTARFAANEGVLTIVGSADFPARTPGVLGYDTTDQIFGKGTFSYVEVLERIFVGRVYDNQKYSLPKLPPAEESYKNIWTILERAASTPKEYYTQIGNERIKTKVETFPFGCIARGTRIILFGATDIAEDYISQIQSQQAHRTEFGRGSVKYLTTPQPFCEIVALVDEHPEEFDNSVQGVERLKILDYDIVVVTVYPKDSQSAFDKILRIVPQMQGRIVYSLHSISI